jgi:hypothetical protein
MPARDNFRRAIPALSETPESLCSGVFGLSVCLVKERRVSSSTFLAILISLLIFVPSAGSPPGDGDR